MLGRRLAHTAGDYDEMYSAPCILLLPQTNQHDMLVRPVSSSSLGCAPTRLTDVTIARTTASISYFQTTDLGLNWEKIAANM